MRRLITSFVSSALLTLAGCGLSTSQRGVIRDFAGSTAELGQITSTELVVARNHVVAMNTTRLSLAKPEEDTPDESDLDEQFDVEAVEVRVAAAETLRSYGELLIALMEDTQEDNLERAGNKFAANVNGLRAADRKLSDAQLEALGKAVAAAGGLVVKCKQAKVIAEVTNDAKPQVDHVARLLEAEFAGDGHLGSQYALTTERLIVQSNEQLDTVRSRQDRTAWLGAFRLASDARGRYEILREISAAAAKVRTASDKLAAADIRCVRSPEFDADTVKEVKELSATVRTIANGLKVLK